MPAHIPSRIGEDVLRIARLEELLHTMSVKFQMWHRPVGKVHVIPVTRGCGYHEVKNGRDVISGDTREALPTLIGCGIVLEQSCIHPPFDMVEEARNAVIVADDGWGICRSRIGHSHGNEAGTHEARDAREFSWNSSLVEE